MRRWRWSPGLGEPYSGFLSREKTSEIRVSVAIHESFLRENLFQAIRESFLSRKKPGIRKFKSSQVRPNYSEGHDC